MPTAAGFGEVSIKFQHASLARPAFITFGVDPVETDPVLVADSVKLAWLASGSLNSRLDSNVTATEFLVRLGTDGGEDLVGLTTGSAPGGLSGSSCPPNVAVLVHKRTARGGRRGRGRMFLPWMAPNATTDEAGQLGTSVAGLIQTAAATFNGELITRNVPMVILHNPGKSSMGAPNRVTSMQCSGLVATQRRRLGR